MFDYKSTQEVFDILGQVFSKDVFENKAEEQIFKDERQCFENLKDQDGEPDFAETWFKCHCVGKSSCKIPGLTYSPNYNYLWDPDTSTIDDVKKEKFVFYERRNWLGY